MLAERANSVAAVIVEPMLQGAGGMIVWPAEFLSGVRQLCDRYGTLMIADEILTGFGRTGRMFACEHASVSPDLICLSKALTGGYLPLAVTAATEPIYGPFSATTARRRSFTGIPTQRILWVAPSPWQAWHFFARRELSTALEDLEKQFRETAGSPASDDARSSVTSGVSVRIAAIELGRGQAGWSTSTPIRIPRSV